MMEKEKHISCANWILLYFCKAFDESIGERLIFVFDLFGVSYIIYFL